MSATSGVSNSTVGLHYDKVEKWCNDVVSSGNYVLFQPESFRRALHEISEKYEFPHSSLHSLIRNVSLLHVKKTAHILKKNLPKYLNEYKRGTASILDLAKAANYPPYLFSRYIVEAVAILPNGKKSITEAMRDPEGLLGNIKVIDKQYLMAEEQRKDKETITRLAREVKEAIDSDPMYGPKHDRARHFIGIEYEVVLEQTLLSMDIPFETESQLRDRGTSRTPDILLSCPLGVKVSTTIANNNDRNEEWKVVCWIDSKAMFGDETTHRTSVLPQAESYVHRFGPGLVLYWFGHAPLNRLADGQGDIIIAAWDIPEVFMLPTGEYLVRRRHEESEQKQQQQHRQLQQKQEQDSEKEIVNKNSVVV